MCRMIASLGDAPGEELVAGLVAMARGENELQERNRNFRQFQHSGGWGAIYQENSAFKLYKSIKPCWEDPRRHELAGQHLLLLHARKASRGNVKLENTHPFFRRHEGRDWFFCHNGTIYDRFPQYAGLAGDTDSERFFRFLIAHNPGEDEGELVRAVNMLHHYTSLNCFFLCRQTLFVINKYDERGKTPEYYTLYYYRDRGQLIISSERLLSLGDKWTPLANGEILKIKLQSPYRVRRLTANTVGMLAGD